MFCCKGFHQMCNNSFPGVCTRSTSLVFPSCHEASWKLLAYKFLRIQRIYFLTFWTKNTWNTCDITREKKFSRIVPCQEWVLLWNSILLEDFSSLRLKLFGGFHALRQLWSKNKKLALLHVHTPHATQGSFDTSRKLVPWLMEP